MSETISAGCRNEGAAASRARRAFDVAVASVLLTVAIPLILGSALVLAASYRCWPFFTQVRVGRDGRGFRFLKLRTLPPSAPAYADKYEIKTVVVPRFARLLRATHLDELPQLLLVISGHMSLVGPRPEMPQLHAAFRTGHRAVRESFRPGCAGMWQVSIDNHRLIHEAPEYDLFYAEHSSLRLDLWILWRTALLAVGGRRVSMDDVPAWALRERDAEGETFDTALAA